MRIHIIAPALPPKLDGIGDHSARLAAGLAAFAEIVILSPFDEPADPIAGLRIQPSFSPTYRRSVRRLLDLVLADRPDWLILQYNPFSYGRWGLNLALPAVIAEAKRRLPGLRFALYAHEQFVPVDHWKNIVYTTWQRWQFRQLGRSADLILSSTGTWADMNRRRFAGTSVVHMPVGSNLPRVVIDRNHARDRLSIESGERILGVFGRTHNSRLMAPLANALSAAKSAGHRAVLLYVGPDADAFQSIADKVGVRIIADGRLSAEEVSCRLSAVDVYLSTFDDGISTRRGSFLAALQHGLAAAATVGRNTDPVFRDAAGIAFLPADPLDPHGLDEPVRQLLSDPPRRQKVAAAAAELFSQEFAWPRLIDRLVQALTGGIPRPVGGHTDIWRGQSKAIER